ncbi:hypothetical protein HanHA300_Chr17g0650291 [Helianthus annuus]|nr:hypothetical protein HanHA300_Chr17g0650291 [Helianthus annuus]KAJ0447150.1 hypothetical protein HanHA89_Chr17g0702101 [Helianthus annuus]KAJ0632058.1 hypothetical protein HanLR1_Chr17g0660801 [Helianthus annuus]KAJ0635937.1 hypothetical protein HanOQP8_Chr17g0656291 [Helianthus annuus]
MRNRFFFRKLDGGGHTTPETIGVRGKHLEFTTFVVRITVRSFGFSIFTRALLREISKRNQCEYTRISPFLLLPLLGCNMFTYQKLTHEHFA